MTGNTLFLMRGIVGKMKKESKKCKYSTPEPKGYKGNSLTGDYTCKGCKKYIPMGVWH
jgi:hypothetical protein